MSDTENVFETKLVLSVKISEAIKEAAKCTTKDMLIGHLYGITCNGQTHVIGAHISKDSSHEKFEYEFDKACNYIPAGIQVCGMFFKTTQSDVPMIIQKVCQTVMPANSILRPCYQQDRVVVLAVEQTKCATSPSLSCYWFSFERQELTSADICQVDDCDAAVASLMIYRIQASIPFGFEHFDKPELQRHAIRAEFDHLDSRIGGAGAVYRVSDSTTLLYGLESEEWPPGQEILPTSPAERLLDICTGASEKTETTKRQRIKAGTQVINISLLRQMTGPTAVQKSISCAPVIHHEHKKYRYVSMTLSLDVLVVAPRDVPVSRLPQLFSEGVRRQLSAMCQCVLINCSDGRCSTVKPFHFLLPGFGYHVSVVYPESTSEEKLESTRKQLHRELFVPTSRPVFRRMNAVRFAPDGQDGGYLLDVHVGLPPSRVKNGRVSVVHGSYAYHHYMQDRVDDSGWGCAYRSLQTLVSWFRLQGYTSVPVPTHTEIQQALVTIGDKPAPFVGSSKWIGSTEVGYVLDHLLGLTCKVLHVSSGAEMAVKARELAKHFDTQGTPIMIGGGVLAHTILGVDWCEQSGDVKFLILDPHYTGGEDLKTIQDKGWCGWKGPEFWKVDSFYNMCLPQRPIVV